MKTKSVLENLTENSPNRALAAANKFIASNSGDCLNLCDYTNATRNLSLEESKDIFYENNFSERQYENLRKSPLKKNIKVETYKTVLNNSCSNDLLFDI